MTHNVQRLEAAGVVKKTPLPEPYKSFVDSLSEQEVEALIRFAERLCYMDVQAHGIDEAPPDEFFVVL